jgi:dihydroorotate dehydrogenase
MGLDFPNRLGLAAGLDKNGEHIAALSALGFGFLEIGTVTPRPQPGNPKPRMFRIPEAEGIINRMGFNNRGVDYLIEQVTRTKFKGILGINIGKNFDTAIDKAVEDYLICMEKVYPYASYITINISSPNTPGLRDLQNNDALITLLGTLKEAQKKLSMAHEKYVPIAVKIAPDLDNAQIKNVAQICIAQKMDGVISSNTTLSRQGVSRYRHGQEMGGLSGKPLFEKSLYNIKILRDSLRGEIPIIACGGIMCAEDANRMIAAGADLIQIYTGLIYRGPRLIKDCA